MTIKRILSNPEFIIGSLIVLVFLVVSIAAPTIAPPEGDDPYLLPRDGYTDAPQPPSPNHPLGTMPDQYDVLYGLVWGGRMAFQFGLVITLGRTLIGVMVGLLCGYYGGRLDGVVMRITDAFLALPVVAIILVMLAFFASELWGVQNNGINRIIVLSLILFGWMQYARLVRGNVLAERAKQYVEAAISIGARDRRIIFRHVLPNAAQGLLVLIASDVGAMVSMIAALNFIGICGPEPTADWGVMLKFSRNWIVGTPIDPFAYWYAYIPPSLAIVLFSIGWNLVGDGLREATDPYRRALRSSRR